MSKYREDHFHDACRALGVGWFGGSCIGGRVVRRFVHWGSGGSEVLDSVYLTKFGNILQITTSIFNDDAYLLQKGFNGKRTIVQKYLTLCILHVYAQFLEIEIVFLLQHTTNL